MWNISSSSESQEICQNVSFVFILAEGDGSAASHRIGKIGYLGNNAISKPKVQVRIESAPASISHIFNYGKLLRSQSKVGAEDGGPRCGLQVGKHLVKFPIRHFGKEIIEFSGL